MTFKDPKTNCPLSWMNCSVICFEEVEELSYMELGNTYPKFLWTNNGKLSAQKPVLRDWTMLWIPCPFHGYPKMLAPLHISSRLKLGVLHLQPGLEVLWNSFHSTRTYNKPMNGIGLGIWYARRAYQTIHFRFMFFSAASSILSIIIGIWNDFNG